MVSLPSTISSLVFAFRSITVEAFTGNQLTGPLPDLTQLTLATDLLASKNQFTGTIPSALLELTAAVRIDVVSTLLAHHTLPEG